MFNTQTNPNPQAQSMQLNQFTSIIKSKALVNQLKSDILFQESS
jgi:hypothetical protein